jgi:hypothetical protein
MKRMKKVGRRSEHWNEKEMRWRRLRCNETGDELISISKFSTDETTITLEEIIREWPAWSREERLDFIDGYYGKDPKDEEDLGIIEYLLGNAGSLQIMSNLPSLITQLSDKRRALRILIKEVRETKLEEICEADGLKAALSNFYQAIGILGDHGAIPLMKEKITEMLEFPGLCEEGAGCNPIALAFIYALQALCRLEPRDDYKRLLEGFRLHPNMAVAEAAERILKDI